LSTFFGFLALLAYVRYVDVSKVQSPKSKVWYVWALVFFALSLMAKPMLVTLPFLMLLLDFWPLGRIRNAAALILEKVPFFFLTVASSIITFLAQRSEAVLSLEQRPIGLRFANAAVSYVRYLGKAIWPLKLSVIYPLPSQIPAWQIVATAILLCVVS